MDTKKYGHLAKQNMLTDQAEKYASELIDKLKPQNGKELATMLEYGDHGSAFSLFNDRIKAAGEKSVRDDFIKGKLSVQPATKSVSEISAMMKKADEGVISFNSRFSDVMKGLGKIEKQRKEMVEMIKKAEAEGKPFDFNSKKYKEFEKNVKQTWSKMNSYMKDKNQIIKEKGGNHKKEEDIALLGKNGEKRYMAMREAGIHLTSMLKLTMRFKQYTPDKRTDQILASTDKNFIGKADDFKAEAYRELFRQEKNKIRDASFNEEKNRADIQSEYRKSGKTAEDAKNYKEKMVDSAVRSLYADTVTSVLDDKVKKLLENPNAEDFSKNAETLLKEYKVAVNKTVTVENGKPVINANSEQLTSFKNGVLAEGDPFKKEFSETVLKAAEKGKILSLQVTGLRDEALGNCLKEAKTKEDINKYQKLSKAFGSKAADNFNKNAVKKAEEIEKQQKKGAVKL